MPNKSGLTVRPSRAADARAQDSRTALAHALFALIAEKGAGFESITVREILDRAGVGRTTFYSHFRSKEDVLNSSYETVFTAYKPLIGLEKRRAPRLFPVAEFVEHVARSKPVMASLRRAGLADDMKRQFVGYAADIIETRFRNLQLATTV
ncbi:MAG: TetR/AcrR family transcriptional regulator, partial [Gemmatimonadaceae bacterium]